ncbi:MAG: LTA synthase family protein, partial [Alistipes sp.]|nr:LTA synthase family protein [Alistipes sp.]
MRNIFKTYPTLTLCRILLLYAVLMICRVIFALYNLSVVGDIELSELPRLIYGGLRFDTISICYAFGVWVLLSLLPLRVRAHKVYRGILFYYYVIVGAFCVAVNMADAVYFRYTQKRFTADEFMFTENSNSVQLVFKFAAENIHLVVIGFALIALLVWGYRRKVTPTALLKGWLYYPANTVILCLALTLCVAGIRGGLSRMARPTAIPYSLKFAKTGDKANIVLSNPFCILRTIGSNRLAVPHYFDAEQLANIYTPYHLPKANGEFRPRNVVIFVIESMSAENSAFLAPELYENSEQKGYTPFLDSLMQSGYAFKRMYANGKRSIQALPSIWGSIPSLVKPFMLMPQSLGESRPLPVLLQ